MVLMLAICAALTSHFAAKQLQVIVPSLFVVTQRYSTWRHDRHSLIS